MSKAKRTSKKAKNDETLLNENEAVNSSVEEEESGAEISMDPPQETQADLEANAQAIDIEKEIADIEESDDDELEQNDESFEEDNEDSEEDIAEYEKIREDLLKEYGESKSNSKEEDPENNEEIDEMLEPAVEPEPFAAENFVESTDDDLEIEDVEETIDGNIIKTPNTMSNQDSDKPDVDQGISKVALSKGSSFAILGVVLLILIFIIYKIQQPSDEEIAAQKSTINKNAPTVRPVEDIGQTIVVPEVPKFPDMPKELTPPAPKALPTPPMPATLDLGGLTPPAPPPAVGAAPAAPSAPSLAPLSAKSVSVTSVDKAAAAREAAEAARKKARIKSSMMAGGGGGGNSGAKNVNDQGQSLTILQRNSAQTVATHIGELQRVIAAGKVIDAVLETAINTDLPGMIRAIVSRDVYSEAGNNILITKGSRLIGSYGSTIKFGQARVQIAWDRLIRPDGVDIKVSSPGIDDIGRSGSAGDVDNHIMRNFATAMMVSMINIAVAEYAERNGAGSTTSTVTTNTDGSTTDTGTATPVDQAYQDAVDNLSSITTDVIDKTKDMPPTITIDQGTSLKVFVKQDLVFPGRSANLTRVIE